MNEKKRNIVVDYFGKDATIKRLKIIDYKDRIVKNSINSRFPHVEYIDNLSELKRKSGFLLVTCLDEFDDIYYDVNYKHVEPDFYEFDRLNRKRFKNFQYVIIISIENLDWNKRKIPHSNILFYSEENYSKDLNVIDELYSKYALKINKKFSKIKISNIEKLRQYIKIKNKDFYTTKEIMNSLNVSDKWVKRYMSDMNSLYNNIGYNAKLKKWYIVK